MARVSGTIAQLERIHDLVTIKGEMRLGEGKDYFAEDYVMEVNDDYVQIKAVSAHIALVNLRYRGLDIEETGTIVINDAEHFEDILGRFNSEDEIVLEDSDENGLVITREDPPKEFSMGSTDKDNIHSYDGAEKFASSIEYVEDEDYYKTSSWTMDAMATIDAGLLDEIVEDAQTVEASSYPLELTDDGSLKLDLGEAASANGVFTNKVPVKESKGQAASLYQYALGGIVNYFDGPLKLYFADKGPMLVLGKDDDYEVIYFIAPVQQDGDE